MATRVTSFWNEWRYWCVAWAISLVAGIIIGWRKHEYYKHVVSCCSAETCARYHHHGN